MTDSDLVYDGRARKRPPGASEFVQRLYTLLADHPEGLTRDELHAEMREGWLDTDAYRAYEHRLTSRRARYKIVRAHRGDGGAQFSYGSEEFKARAQRWWIYEKLKHMQGYGAALRAGDRWFAGRPPKVHTFTSRTKGTYVPLDVEAKRKREHSATQDHIRREELKVRLMADLNAHYPGKSATRDHLLDTIQLAYNYISGR